VSEPGETLNWQRSEPIALPAPAAEGRLAVRRSDWVRIRRCVRHLSAPTSRLQTWYSLCFGFAISAGVSIVPLAASTGLPTWVVPAYVCSTVAALLLGLAVVWLDRSFDKKRKEQITDLDADMDDVEKAFIRDQAGT
jgi:hypothetical protein